MRLRLILLLTLFFASHASACMWDYDTLRDEQRGLPGVLEIINGHYEQRSDFFYRDRIAKMQTLLAADPNNQPAIDNLAVALFRVGQREQAIATLVDKERRFPNQYTTASNLATFYMLSGDSASAVPLLEKALQINLNAHFGREKYQLQLAKFLIEAAAAHEYPTKDFLGVDPFASRYPPTTQPDDEPPFADPAFVHSHWNQAVPLTPEQDAAMKGILGMIRFGTNRSPDLFYALGNLLTAKGDRNLATRAYARAVALKHPRAKEIEELSKQIRGSIAKDGPTDESIQQEWQAGQAWADSYMAYSDALIRAGKDSEDESNFATFYRSAGSQTAPLGFAWRDWLPKRTSGYEILVYGLLLLIPVLILRFTWQSIRRRRKRVAA